MSEAAQTDVKADMALPAPQNFAGVTPSTPAAPVPEAPAPEKLPVIDAHAEEILTPLDTLLNRHWGALYEREALMQFVNPNNVKQTKKGIGFTLDNGIQVIWSPMLIKDKEGNPVEFIGVPGKLFGKPDFDQDAANAVIMLAVSKGWQSINLHGPKEHQEMMWLAAQKFGMPVTNFVPEADSKIWKRLEQESPEAYQATMQRMLNGPGTPQQPKEENAAAPKNQQIPSRFAEDPFEKALKERIDQTQNPQEAAGLKQILDSVKNGQLVLDQKEKESFLQKLDSPIIVADSRGRVASPVETAIAMFDQKLNAVGTHPKPPEPK